MDAYATKPAQEYLEKIRRTIAESKCMMESVKLRLAETDRMLVESGTSREEVAKLRFTPQQIIAVNEELRRRGMQPLDGLEIDSDCAAASIYPRSAATADIPENMDNRRRKFGAMMNLFRM